MEQLSEKIKIPEVNACLGNMYDDGNNYICFHSDNINKLIKNSYIISVTLGHERTFRIKSIKTSEVLDIKLKSGSVLLMSLEMQKLYQQREKGG